MLELFKGVLRLSLSLSPLLLLLVIGARRYSRRYSSRFRYLLWLGVFLRLLLPVSSGAAARLFLPAGEAVYIIEHDAAAVLRAFAEAGAAELGAAAGGPAPVAALNWISVLAMTWAVGAAVYLLFHLGAGCTVGRRLHRWSATAEKETQLAQQLAAELGIRRRFSVYRCSCISSPMLVGVFSPQIFVPAVNLDAQALDSALRHELHHLGRRDLWYKLVLLLGVSLHWMNPLVHMAARRAEEDLEISCDAAVLQGAGSAKRRAYGMALLSYAQVKGQRIKLSTGFSGGENMLRRRVENIVDTSAKRLGIPALVVLLSIATAGGTWVGIEQTVFAMDISTAAQAEQQGENEPPQKQILAAYPVDKINTEEYIGEVYAGLSWAGGAYTQGEMQWPVPGFYTITSAYGWRFDGRDFHTGLDISGADIADAPVVASASGTVQFVNHAHTPDVGYGKYIILDHGGGISTLYAQLNGIEVWAGQQVEAGQVIGQVGDTGFTNPGAHHLHFEVRQDGAHTDPYPYLVKE